MISVINPQYFIWYEIHPDLQLMSLTISDGENIWTKNIDENSRPKSRSNESIEQYINTLKEVFNTDGIRYENEINLLGSKNLEFIIKESLSGTTKTLLLKIILGLNSNSKEESLKLLKLISQSFLTNINRIKERNEYNKVLESKIALLQEEVQRASNYKDIYQDELLQKFTLLLNSKKRRIIQLQYQLQHNSTTTDLSTTKTNDSAQVDRQHDEEDASDHEETLGRTKPKKKMKVDTSKASGSKQYLKKKMKLEIADKELPVESSQLSQILRPIKQELNSQSLEHELSQSSQRNITRKSSNQTSNNDIIHANSNNKRHQPSSNSYQLSDTESEEELEEKGVIESHRDSNIMSTNSSQPSNIKSQTNFSDSLAVYPEAVVGGSLKASSIYRIFGSSSSSSDSDS